MVRAKHLILYFFCLPLWGQDTCKVVIDYDPADCIFQYTYDRDLYLFGCDSTTVLDQAHYDYDISGNVVNSTTLNGWIDWSGIIGDTLNILNPNIDSCYYLCDKVRDWCNFGVVESEWDCVRFELTIDPLPCLNGYTTDSTYVFGACDPTPPQNCNEYTYLYQEYILTCKDSLGNLLSSDTLIQYSDCSIDGGFFTSSEGGGKSKRSLPTTGTIPNLFIGRTNAGCDPLEIELDSLTAGNSYELCAYASFLCDEDTLKGGPVCDTLNYDPCSQVQFELVDSLQTTGEIGVNVINGAAPFVTQWQGVPISGSSSAPTIDSDYGYLRVTIIDARGCSCTWHLVIPNSDWENWQTADGAQAPLDYWAGTSEATMVSHSNYSNLGDLGLTVDFGEVFEESHYAVRMCDENSLSCILPDNLENATRNFVFQDSTLRFCLNTNLGFELDQTQLLTDLQAMYGAGIMIDELTGFPAISECGFGNQLFEVTGFSVDSLTSLMISVLYSDGECSTTYDVTDITNFPEGWVTGTQKTNIIGMDCSDPANANLLTTFCDVNSSTDYSFCTTIRVHFDDGEWLDLDATFTAPTEGEFTIQTQCDGDINGFLASSAGWDGDLVTIISTECF